MLLRTTQKHIQYFKKFKQLYSLVRYSDKCFKQHKLQITQSYLSIVQDTSFISLNTHTPRYTTLTFITEVVHFK